MTPATSFPAVLEKISQMYFVRYYGLQQLVVGEGANWEGAAGGTQLHDDPAVPLSLHLLYFPAALDAPNCAATERLLLTLLVLIHPLFLLLAWLQTRLAAGSQTEETVAGVQLFAVYWFRAVEIADTELRRTETSSQKEKLIKDSSANQHLLLFSSRCNGIRGHAAAEQCNAEAPLLTHDLLL